MAVAMPSIAREINPSVCSLITIISKITPTAKNPGTSLTVCNKPMSEPSKSATWTTKLFNNADQTLNAIGIAMAIINKRKIGLRQKGKPLTSNMETERAINITYNHG
jgi:hypothetical protein